jgi:putative addiction module killer protein
VYEIELSHVFTKWFDSLRNSRAKRAIDARLRRAALGNLGDNKPVGDGVFEMRVNCGTAYRLYFVNKGTHWILLLCGGDKSSQPKDIKRAKELAKEI